MGVKRYYLRKSPWRQRKKNRQAVLLGDFYDFLNIAPRKRREMTALFCSRARLNCRSGRSIISRGIALRSIKRRAWAALGNSITNAHKFENGPNSGIAQARFRQ